MMQNDMSIDGQNISTWYAKQMNIPFHAINMTAAVWMLRDYDLTEDDKTKIPALMAGYCRLVDEAGLSGSGETEFQAIHDLFSNEGRFTKSKSREERGLTNGSNNQA